MDVICVLLFSSPHRLRFVSAVFDFNASLNKVAPLSSIALSVCLMRIEKGGLLMGIIYVLFLLCSLSRLSSVSFLFDFSASLNDFAPVSPISLPVVFL